ncbi:MAG: ribosomal protein S5-alanine N-acetyltransferase [Planctomycetota bacterium]|nr:ribosomal protein S5-alanine N-acetyltransferase [Planctomycetota bacterium]
MGPLSKPPLPRLETDRLLLRLPGPEFAARMVDYYLRNAAHLRPWEPRRSEDFLQTTWWESQLAISQEEYRLDRSVRTVLLERADPEGPVIGVANLSNVVRGAFQASYLGYNIDQRFEGQGYMYEGLERLVRWCFEDFGLHRVMANYRPENERSGRLLARLGFEREGYARKYLHIDGEWRDHVLTARVRG